MLRTGGICCNKRNIDFSCCNAGQFDLCLFCLILQTLHSGLITGEVNTLVIFKALYKPINDFLVKVIAAEMVITGCSKNFLYSFAHFNNRHIESTAAEVIYHYFLFIFFVYAIRKSSSCRLVDNTLNIQSCDFAGILRCLTLCVGKVSRNGNDSLRYRLTEICFCIFFQLGEYHCRNFLRCIVFIVDLNFVGRTHFSFNRRNGVVRVGNRLTLCHLTYQSFAVLRKCNNRRRCSCSFCIGDDDRFAAFNNSNARVCCTKINTNCFSHNDFPPK